jgi:drug/metabolite transporter (DMT)-like permease
MSQISPAEAATRSRTGVGIAFAFAAATLYGVVPTLFRAAFEAGIPALESALARTTLMIAVTGVYALVRRESLAIPRAAWPSLVAQALATAVISLCYGASVQFIPVGLAVIIFFTCPLIILVLAPLIEGARIGAGRLLTALAGFAGLGIALGLRFDALDWRGIVLAALAAAGYAAQFFSGRAVSRHLRPTAIACLAHLLVLPIALAAVLWRGGGGMRLLDGAGVAPIGYVFALGVAGAYIAGYLLHMLSLRNAPASTIAPIFNIEPIVTTAAAAIGLGEVLTAHQYVGGAIVLAAVVAASRMGRAIPESPKSAVAQAGSGSSGMPGSV